MRGRVSFDHRYLFMLDLFTTQAIVQTRGQVAGFWGRSRACCPCRAGRLRDAWVYGWQRGREERLRAIADGR